MPEPVNALMPSGEFANTAEDADALDRAVDLERRIRLGDSDSDQQWRNKSDAFRAGLVSFISADQAARRAFLGAPYISGDETARWRQNYPFSYYGGQAAGFGGSAIVDPALAAGLTGAAIYNNPTVQRAFRDYALPAAAFVAAPYAMLRRAFNASSNRNRLLEEDQ